MLVCLTYLFHRSPFWDTSVYVYIRYCSVISGRAYKSQWNWYYIWTYLNWIAYKSCGLGYNSALRIFQHVLVMYTGRRLRDGRGEGEGPRTHPTFDRLKVLRGLTPSIFPCKWGSCPPTSPFSPSRQSSTPCIGASFYEKPIFSMFLMFHKFLF